MKKTTLLAIIVLFLGVFSVFSGATHVAQASSLCTINSFYASPNNVSSGGSTTLNISTSNCQNVSLSGGTYSNYQAGTSNSLSVGPLYSTTTFTLTGFDYYNNQTTNSIVVTVNGVGGQNNLSSSASTYAPTNIYGTSATFNGTINTNTANCMYNFYYSNNCSNNGNVSYYFQYGPSQYSLTQQTATQTFNTTSGNVTAYVSNLQPNTSYSVQLVVVSNNGTNYGGIQQFVTNNSNGGTGYNGYNNNNGPIVATTGNANVNTNSASLSGTVSSPQSGVPISVYFEYATSQNCFGQYGTLSSCTQQTSTLPSVTNYNAVNYNGNISTISNTTYYYRIVAISGGQTFDGSILSFTSSAAAYVPPPMVSPAQPVTPVSVFTRMYHYMHHDNTASAVVAPSVSIIGNPQTVVAGNSVNYLVTYQNNSKNAISNAVLNVTLPFGITFQQSSQGVVTTNNTVVASIGTLAPGQQGTLNILGTAGNSGLVNNNLVATVTLVYTNSDNTQGNVMAETLNSTVVANQNNMNMNMMNTTNLAPTNVIDSGFFPTTLFGWILVLGLILIIIFVAREFYTRTNMMQRNSNSSPDQYHNH